MVFKNCCFEGCQFLDVKFDRVIFDNCMFSVPVIEKGADANEAYYSTTTFTRCIFVSNADVAEYMSMQLRSRYRLAVAHDGEEGLRMATDTVPDLIITDLMMPRMDGYELCQAVKQSEVLNHIPVIIVTAKTKIGRAHV